MSDTAEFSVTEWWDQKLGQLHPFHICAILCGLGTLLMWGNPVGFWHSLGEAFLIAGLLVLFVDPMLKRRLLREASRGIFHYLLGYDQQPEIKERLRRLVFDTKLFRKNFHVHCVLTPESAKMRLDMDVSFEIFNPTELVQTYIHATQFEKVERAKSHVMALVSEVLKYSKKNLDANPKEDDIEVLEVKAGPVEIQPSAKGVTYRFANKFSLVYPLEFFYAIHVGTPTLGMRIEVVPPPGFKVTASHTTTSTTNIWVYDRLFMPGEHVDVRWEQSSECIPEATCSPSARD
jgi:hypothetical protein